MWGRTHTQTNEQNRRMTFSSNVRLHRFLPYLCVCGANFFRYNESSSARLNPMKFCFGGTTAPVLRVPFVATCLPCQLSSNQWTPKFMLHRTCLQPSIRTTATTPTTPSIVGVTNFPFGGDKLFLEHTRAGTSHHHHHLPCPFRRSSG